jgi:hypothetical protein
MNSSNVLRKSILSVACFFLLSVTIISCKKEKDEPPLHYYEVGFNGIAADWRDSSFIIATNNPALVEQAEQQLLLPVAQRKIVNGRLLNGNGGYNKNAAHTFKWHFKESDWSLTDLSIEIYDGRPYSDVDNNLNYWLHTMKRFAPWGSYIKREMEAP